MPRKAPEDSRLVSVRQPNTLVQRLDRLGDGPTPHRRRPTTRNAAMRDAWRGWLDQQEPRAGLLDPQGLQPPCQAAAASLRPSPDGGPSHRRRRLRQWPRERFAAVLAALRAAPSVALDALTAQAFAAQATPDSDHGHGQCSGRLRWRACARNLSQRRPPVGPRPWPAALASGRPPRAKSPPHVPRSGRRPAPRRLRLRRPGAPCPGRGCPGGAGRAAAPVLPPPDPDDPQLPCIDPTP